MTRKSRAPTTRPVVIYRLGSLGDTVVALPCFHRIERSFPNVERIALTNFPVNSKASALGSILGSSGLIGSSIAYPVGLRSIAGFWNLRERLLALGSDTLIYLTPPRGMKTAWRDRLFFRLCGFKTIIGLPLSADLQRNRVEEAGDLEPEYQRLARCIEVLGPIDLDAASSWDLRLTSAEQAEARKVRAPFADSPFLAINMGGKVVKNDWGIDNWLSLIERLRTPLQGHGLLILGGPEDETRALQVAQRWQGPTVSGCGRMSPRVSGAAAQGAALFIGHDSGPLHLAACVGVACVGLFGDNNPPKKWHPPPKHRHRVIHKMEGVMAISVDEVVVAALALIGKRRDVA